MSVQALITFTALTPGVVPPVRNLKLDVENDGMRIGRASKSVSKDYLAKEDNAWFDSPVMSREHAEITLDIQEQVVRLSDIGSMHGTKLNGTELKPHESITLRDKDVVAFGAEVRRGQETFPACHFEIGYKITATSQPANTIKFPEFSDGEDESSISGDDYEADIQDIEDELGYEENVMSWQNPPFCSSAPTATIDLTGDDESEPQNLSTHSVAASSNEKSSNKNWAHDYRRIGRAEYPVVINEDEASISDDESESEVKYYHNNGSGSQGSIQNQGSEGDSLTELNAYGFKEDEEFDFEDDLSINPLTVEAAPSETAAWPFGSHGSANLTEVKVAAPMTTPQVAIVADHGSLHEEVLILGAKAILPDIVERSGDLSPPQLLTPSVPDDQSLGEGDQTDESSPLATNNPHKLFSSASFTSVVGALGFQEERAVELNRSSLASLERSSSPSDAALVKNLPRFFGAHSIEPRTPVHSSAADSKREFGLVEELMKKNRPDRDVFFKAREENLAMLRAVEKADAFASEHHQAVNSQENKRFATPTKATGVRNVKNIQTKGEVLAISRTDITQSTKRKSDQISEVLDAEMRAWGSLPVCTETVGDASRITTSGRIFSAPDTSSAGASQSHATKKLKRFAEKAGYIALGGVAFGAGLFSYLVTSAPEFV